MSTVLITGASRGIGREICESLSKLQHFEVYGIGRSNIKTTNFNYFSTDISKKNSLSLLDKKIPKLDVLINNAGTAIFSDFSERTKEEFMRVTEVNLFGTFNCINQLSKHMINNGIKG